MLYLVADYYLVTKKLRERIPLLGLGFVRRRRFISDYLSECPNYGVWLIWCGVGFRLLVCWVWVLMMLPCAGVFIGGCWIW